MPRAATVVIPTHDHGPTLLRSVRSAMEQTVGDIEIVVVGDGAPDVTRSLMASLVAEDSRVRYLDNPKGERLGEVHRRVALRDTTGEVVCYLCDDDLWLPGHVAAMLDLLGDADIAHSLPVGVDEHGDAFVWRVDLSEEADQRLHLEGHNRVPLSCFAHTRSAYERLPEGWRPGPATLPSDLHFYQQFLRQPWCRAVSGRRATSVHFPSPLRTGWSEQERLDELDRWRARLRDDPAGLFEDLVDHLDAELVAHARQASEVQAYARSLEAHAAQLEAHQREVAAYVRGLEGELARRVAR